MDCRCSHTEETLQVGLSRRDTVNSRVNVDEREIAALEFGEGLHRLILTRARARTSTDLGFSGPAGLHWPKPQYVHVTSGRGAEAPGQPTAPCPRLTRVGRRLELLCRLLPNLCFDLLLRADSLQNKPAIRGICSLYLLRRKRYARTAGAERNARCRRAHSDLSNVDVHREAVRHVRGFGRRSRRSRYGGDVLRNRYALDEVSFLSCVHVTRENGQERCPDCDALHSVRPTSSASAARCLHAPKDTRHEPRRRLHFRWLSTRKLPVRSRLPRDATASTPAIL